MRRLNVGCGRDVRPGWVNLDRAPLPGVDVVHDLERGRLPFDDQSFDEVLCRDVLEHVDVLATMRELHRILRPGGRLHLRVPHFTSRNVWDDPTHRRGFALTTFDMFLPHHRRAWQVDAHFARVAARRLEFEKTWVLSFNRLVEPLVNRLPLPRYLYEGTWLSRLLPAENVVVELVK